jgi:hypothetical protein
LEEGAFIIYTFSNHPPRRLRTALLMTQHPEHIIQVVAHHLRTAVRNHLRRA